MHIYVNLVHVYYFMCGIPHGDARQGLEYARRIDSAELFRTELNLSVVLDYAMSYDCIMTKYNTQMGIQKPLTATPSHF